VHKKSIEISASDFSIFENDHLKIEFLLEDMNGDKRYKVLLTPKQKITLIDFYIETNLDYTESKGIFCNGFQSWTETKIFSKEDKLKAQRRGVKVIGEAYGDGMLYEYKNKKRNCTQLDLHVYKTTKT
jgi:hypothetical protein